MAEERKGRTSRREAIRRLGMLGVGAAIAGRPGAIRTDDEPSYSSTEYSSQVYVSCTYYSCWDFYQSQNTYTSSDGVSIYGSISSYSSSCTCMQ